MLTVACVNWGHKYDSEYIYRLEAMVTRNLTAPHRFVCITDDSDRFQGETITPDNEFGLDEWWPKMFLYRPNLLTGRVLYLDMDTVIQSNIDALVGYSDGFCGVYTKWNDIETDGDYPYSTLRHKKPFNSSVLTFNAEDYYWLWERFAEDPFGYMMKYYGDDKFLGNELPEYDTFPDEWVYSRLYGIDETTPCNDKARLSKFTSQSCHYYPDRKICLLNGPTEAGHYDGNLRKYWYGI